MARFVDERARTTSLVLERIGQRMKVLPWVASTRICRRRSRRVASWGRFLARHHFSCVLDLSDFTLGEQRRFVAAFAEQLYQHNRTPLHLVIDEADEFAPQNPRGEQRVLGGHVARLVQRGRRRGFRVIMITQRPSRGCTRTC